MTQIHVRRKRLFIKKTIEWMEWSSSLHPTCGSAGVHQPVDPIRHVYPLRLLLASPQRYSNTLDRRPASRFHTRHIPIGHLLELRSTLLLFHRNAPKNYEISPLLVILIDATSSNTSTILTSTGSLREQHGIQNPYSNQKKTPNLVLIH